MFNVKVCDERIKIAKVSKNDLLTFAKESFLFSLGAVHLVTVDHPRFTKTAFQSRRDLLHPREQK